MPALFQVGSSVAMHLHALALYWAVALTDAMFDGIYPHHEHPPNCKHGCALWSDLAADGCAASQSEANALWSGGVPPAAASRFCATPAHNPGENAGWCYCRDSGSEAWGYCTPSLHYPSELGVYPVKDGAVVIAFVTLSQNQSDGAPEVTVEPSPSKPVNSWSMCPAGGTATHRVMHFVFLGGLAPSVLYKYRVRSGSPEAPWSDFGTFVSLPEAGAATPFTFAIWADMGVYSWNNMDSVIANFEARTIAFAAHIGDHGYDIGDLGRGDGYFDAISAMYTKGLFVPGVGNHEYYHDHFHRYDAYTSGIAKYNPSHSQKYYSLNIGQLHLIVLDSTPYFDMPGSDKAQQREWLEADLKQVNRTRTPWILMTAHHPLYCSSITFYDDDAKAQRYGANYSSQGGFQGCVGSGEEQVAAMRADWEPLMLAYGVDVYMCGHEHNYESIYPVAKGKRIQSSFTDPRAPVHIVSGAGGAPTLDQFGPPGPWTRLQLNNAWSYSKVTVLGAHALKWQQYFNSYYGGGLADEFVITQTAHGPFRGN